MTDTDTDTDRPTETTNRPTETNWRVTFDDVDPIRVRDPVAEALTVLDPGDPFVVTYADVVKAAGHSCPTAAGAYRVAQLGLDALYPDSLPVRGDVAVTAGGPKDDAAYGVMARLISYVTGAAEEDGFGGLAGGHGDRKDLLSYDGEEDDGEKHGGVTFTFERTDTGAAVRVVYHVSHVPDAGPATQYLPKLVAGEATAEERAAFAEAWHGRVCTVLTDDDLFTVERLPSSTDE